jgi:hypothetical protein
LVAAFSLSELDRIEGKMESSKYKLNIALNFNKYCEKLNKIWFDRTNEIKKEFFDYYFSSERSFKNSKEDFISRVTPTFREVIVGDKL